MSNAEAGKLYEAIIDEVINDSRQDFEDSAIDESTLQDLKKIWCEKLSHTHVAKFSWDEENLTNNFEGNVISSHEINQSNDISGGGLRLGGTDLELPIGTESQLSYNTVQPDNSTASMGIQLPNMDAQPKSEYDNITGLMLPKINQADGSFEFTLNIDDGKDFMKKIKRNQKKQVMQGDGADDDEDDEEDEDIFNDSDDINSDLDDGLESEKSDEEDGEQEGQILLCLYDKVQRVKNKWKSNLKEGIANINGKDYVFQKATGESEW